MSNLTISILGNKVFLEIIKELNIFQNTNIKFLENYSDFDLNQDLSKQVVVYFLDKNNAHYLFQVKENRPAILLITEDSKKTKKLSSFFDDQIIFPFKITNFKKKIIAVLVKQEFKQSSEIKLGEYQIDKNEKKIKKNRLELKLTEKEINFLIFFTLQNQPISKDFILKNLWNYSVDADTHTVETHIHRLRKKILKKFKDNNFIKNNDKGYYI